MTENKFKKFDQNQKGHIDQYDIIRAFSSASVPYPAAAARALIRLFSPKGKMDLLEFREMDVFLGQMHGLFRMLNQKLATVAQFSYLLVQLEITLDAATTQSLYDISCQNFNATAMSILAYQFAVVLVQLVKKMAHLYQASGALHLTEL